MIHKGPNSPINPHRPAI